MVPLWFAVLLILVGIALVRGGWTRRRRFEEQWTLNGFLRWVGSIAVGLGVYVLLKAVFGASTAWEVLWETALSFLVAYVVVGVLYRVGRWFVTT